MALLLEPDGTIGWVNPAATEILGYRADELVGHSPLDFVHAEDVDMIHSMVRFGLAHAQAGATARESIDAALDVRFVHHSGHLVTLELFVNNFLARPDIEGVLVVGREATGRRALDDALAAIAQDATGDETVRLLLRFLDLRILDTDNALYAPDEDPRWTTNRVPPELCVERGPWAEAVTSGSDRLFDDLAAAVASGELPAELGTAAIAAGYVACWCIAVPLQPDRVGARPIPFAESNRSPTGCVVVWSRRHREPLVAHWAYCARVAGLVDIVLSRRAAEAQRQRLYELEREQNARLTELDALRSDLLLSVSHELRTPLTSIVGFTHLLQEGLDSDSDSDRAQYLDVIGRNADRLLRLVGDLLVLGRLDDGTLPVAHEACDFPALVGSSVEAATPEADKHDVTIEYASMAGPPLFGDPERLGQLVDNLLSNAVKYSRPGGWVRVVLAPDDDGWELVVEDNGIGIPAADQPTLFDKFARGSNVKEREIDGYGLGLAIVSGIAEIQRGEVTLDSAEGVGSTFTVRLRDAPPPSIA